MGKGRVVGKGTLDVLVKGKPPGHLGPLNQTSKNTDQPTTCDVQYAVTVFFTYISYYITCLVYMCDATHIPS